MKDFSQLWGRVLSWYGDLEERERYLVLGAAAALVLALVVFGLGRLAYQRSRMHRRVDTAYEQIEETKAILREIAGIDNRIKGVELPYGERCTVNLFTALESILRGCGAENISIRPLNVPASSYYTEQAVEIEARQLLLKTLTACLYQIDQSPSEYRAWRFQAKKRFDDPNLLDVRFQVSTFCAKGKEQGG